MDNKVTIVKESYEPVNVNKQAFATLENYWATARLDYLRDIPNDAKNEIERIYKEEIDPNFFPNKWCSACYLNCIKRLINHFQL